MHTLSPAQREQSKEVRCVAWALSTITPSIPLPEKRQIIKEFVQAYFKQ